MKILDLCFLKKNIYIIDKNKIENTLKLQTNYFI